MKTLSFALITLISLISFSSRAEANKDFQIRFGILEHDKVGNIFVSEETTNIPCKLKETGFRFGCEISPPDQASYTYQNITHLPAPPRMVTGKFFDANQEPAKDLVSKVVTISGGKFFDSMHFDAGDPLGTYRHDIFINGKFVKTITFIVHKG